MCVSRWRAYDRKMNGYLELDLVSRVAQAQAICPACGVRFTLGTVTSEGHRLRAQGVVIERSCPEGHVWPEDLEASAAFERLREPAWSEAWTLGDALALA